jgi:hypothetical protein
MAHRQPGLGDFNIDVLPHIQRDSKKRRRDYYLAMGAAVWMKLNKKEDDLRVYEMYKVPKAKWFRK